MRLSLGNISLWNKPNSSSGTSGQLTSNPTKKHVVQDKYTLTIKAEQLSQPKSPSSAELSEGSAVLCRELSSNCKRIPFCLLLSKCVPSSGTERFLSIDVDTYIYIYIRVRSSFIPC